MKKNRMIVNSVVVLAIVSAALAFKAPNYQVYECVENKCHQTFSPVDPDGDLISKIGAETQAPLEGEPCSLCDDPIQFTPEF